VPHFADGNVVSQIVVAKKRSTSDCDACQFDCCGRRGAEERVFRGAEEILPPTENRFFF